MKRRLLRRWSNVMKNAWLLLLILGCYSVSAQSLRPQPPEAPLARPGEPGMKTPSDPGAVVVPPATGNEEMVTIPKNVDPRIDDATPGIDEKNRKKSEGKGKEKEKAR